MKDLEKARKTLAELGKLISEAKHPGAYVNTLSEQYRSAERNVNWLEDEARLDRRALKEQA